MADALHDAAPDLLRACELAAPWLAKMIAQGDHRETVGPVYCERALRAVEAAIDKARGTGANTPAHVTTSAAVTMFGKWRRCEVQPHGEPQVRYTRDQTLWVERGEDLYAMPHYSEPFCVLTRESWLRGEDLTGEA